MKVAFVSELPFMGKVNTDNSQMRTEFAWMNALDADHFPIRNSDVSGYDLVVIIFPKGEVFLNAVGLRLADKVNPVSDILKSDLFDNGEIKETGTFEALKLKNQTFRNLLKSNS